MRVFFPSAARLLTDHRPNGEGLIAWHLLTALARRGHEVSAWAQEVDAKETPPFGVACVPPAVPWASARGLLQAARGGVWTRRNSGVDIVHWLFPQDQRAM